jgi:hypothetical protein
VLMLATLLGAAAGAVVSASRGGIRAESAVALAPRAAGSECGRLRQGAGGHPGGDRRRSGLMLAILAPLSPMREQARVLCPANRSAREGETYDGASHH